MSRVRSWLCFFKIFELWVTASKVSSYLNGDLDNGGGKWAKVFFIWCIKFGMVATVIDRCELSYSVEVASIGGKSYLNVSPRLVCQVGNV